MKELLKKTPLYDWHMDAKAKMAEFAGFSMPISYTSGELAEIKAVRTKAGLFDISHMGQIFVTGTCAREFLNLISVRDLSTINPGESRYTLTCDHSGRPLDDLIISRLPDQKSKRGEEKFMVCSNASNVHRIYKWLRNAQSGYLSYLDSIFDGETLRISYNPKKYGFFALQGPLSESIMREMAKSNEPLPGKNYACEYLTIGSVRCIVFRSGYTGEDGFEILVPTLHAETIWKLLLGAGLSYGLLPCGLASRDILRLEAGMPLFGHELDAEHDPISAGLGRYVDFADADGKKRYFNGHEILKKIADKEILKPTLHGFEMPKGRIPRAGCAVFSRDGLLKIGHLTSAGPSPTLGKNIALGYLVTHHPEGTEVLIEIGGKFFPATVSKRRFYKRT